MRMRRQCSLVARCKKGDAVVTLGAEHVAAGARIVVESKDEAAYKVTRALEEMQQARKNREASLGLFVLSTNAAPDGTPGFARHGDDVIVVWSPEDPVTDVRLEAAFEACRSLTARRARESSTQGADLVATEQAILRHRSVVSMVWMRLQRGRGLWRAMARKFSRVFRQASVAHLG